MISCAIRSQAGSKNAKRSITPQLPKSESVESDLLSKGHALESTPLGAVFA